MPSCCWLWLVLGAVDCEEYDPVSPPLSWFDPLSGVLEVVDDALRSFVDGPAGEEATRRWLDG